MSTVCGTTRFEYGDRVKYVDGGIRHELGLGTVLCTDTFAPSEYMVQWDDGERDSYRVSQLILVQEAMSSYAPANHRRI